MLQAGAAAKYLILQGWKSQAPLSASQLGNQILGLGDVLKRDIEKQPSRRSWGENYVCHITTVQKMQDKQAHMCVYIKCWETALHQYLIFQHMPDLIFSFLGIRGLSSNELQAIDCGVKLSCIFCLIPHRPNPETKIQLKVGGLRNSMRHRAGTRKFTEMRNVPCTRSTTICSHEKLFGFKPQFGNHC